jgi:adenosyl cobinamide kinase/adenosyl cobinamide phosphate guanylyltransferase
VGLVITLVLGGARSGKSAIAEALAAELGDDVVYFATAIVEDPDFAARVERHRLRRPSSWQTVECGAALPSALRRHADQPALVDSLGTWVASLPDFAADVTDLIEALGSRSAPTVVVSEEAGLGVHPETEVGRRWRDALGTVNQAVAAAADEALFVVAGRVLRL